MIISCPTSNDRRLLIRYLAQLGEPVYWPSTRLTSWTEYSSIKWSGSLWVGTYKPPTTTMEDFIEQIKNNNMQVPRE